MLLDGADLPFAIRTVVFDLDDTLFAESDFVRSGFSAVDGWLERERGVHGFRSIALTRFARGERGHVFDDSLRELGVNADPALITAMIEIYRTHVPTLKLLPDAANALEWAKTAGIRLALLTDGYLAVQKTKVAALALAERFEHIVFTDALGRECWKPHPAGFQRLMQQMRGPAEEFVYVADNPRKDFIAPRALGWKTIRIRRQGGEHERYEPTAGEAADAEVRNLGEIESLIRPPSR